MRPYTPDKEGGIKNPTYFDVPKLVNGNSKQFQRMSQLHQDYDLESPTSRAEAARGASPLMGSEAGADLNQANQQKRLLIEGSSDALFNN